MREFHIKNFPKENIRILFKNQNKFLDDAIKYFGTIKNLANHLSVSPQVVSSWKRINLYIPLWAIDRTIDKLNLSWKDIEKNVIAYKGINTSAPIKKPVLPIKETPELLKIITHLIGDGSVNKNGIPIYTNSNEKLISNFKNFLKNSFGLVQGKIYIDQHGNYQYRFSKIIPDLFNWFYNIDFDSSKSGLPLSNRLSINHIKAIIQSFADDESNVDLNNRIGFYSSNKELLKQIRNLLLNKLKFRYLSNISKKVGEFYFYIKSQEVKKYAKEIGFAHPEKNRKLSILLTNKRKSGNHGKPFETKSKILKLLRNKTLATNQMVERIGIRSSNICISLNALKKEGLIEKSFKKGQNIYWTKMEG